MLGTFTLPFPREVALHAGRVLDRLGDGLCRLRHHDAHFHRFIFDLRELRVVRRSVERVGSQTRQLLAAGLRRAAARARRLAGGPIEAGLRCAHYALLGGRLGGARSINAVLAGLHDATARGPGAVEALLR